MRRIAWTLIPAALLFAGCTSSTSSPGIAPAPDPIFSTGYTKALPRPPRRPTPPPREAPRAARPEEVWQTPAAWRPAGGIKPGRWQCIVVHHSEAPNASFQSMHEYHLREKKWANGLGYHFAIGNGVNSGDGEIFVGPRWKRQISGAHCKNDSGRYFGVWRRNNYFNTNGVGICLIGNFENDTPTPKQLQSLERLIRFLSKDAGIDPTRIYGHKEVTHKTLCPGRRFNLAGLKRSLAPVSASARRPSGG